jgi:Arc/MetJ-type ribon-helix-helix transcriptional regulator
MKITAREKRNKPEPVNMPARESEEQSTALLSLPIRCNTILYSTISNMIEAQHTGGDYTFPSVSDVIRSAIQARKEGMDLTELAQEGNKKATTIRVNQELFDYYKSWPERMRAKILDRTIRSYLKRL